MVAFLDLASVVAPLSSVATSHALAWTVALLFLVWLFKKWCLPWLRTWLLLRSMPGPGDWIPFWFLACALWGNRRRLDKENFAAVVFRVITELFKLHEGKTFKAYLGIIPIVGAHTPDAVQAILTAKLKSDKPFLYKFLKPWLGNKSLLMIGGDPWRSKRKLFMQAFQANAMENYCDFIGKNADCLVARIEKMLKQAPDEPIQCLDNVQKCALDIIGRVVLGVDLGVQGEKHGNYGTYFHLLTLLVSMRIFQPWTWLDEIYFLTNSGQLFRETLRKIEDIVYGVMNRRKDELQKLSNHTADSQALEKNRDGSGSLFMDSLLLAHLKAPSSYTLDDVRKDADFMMFAGSDSSSCAISWTIYLLGLHPDIQRKVQEELDVVFGDRENAECTQEDLKSLQYMECCVKETLRLCPPFPYIGKILDQDLSFDGCILPKGLSCFINLFSLHRNPNEFDRPEEYVPERFLSDENTHRHPFSYVPFSAGPKNCLGQKFVMMEIKVVLAKVLSKFTVEATRPLQELEMTFDIVLKAKGGLPVLFRKRNQT
ncbi:cytochrome P450 4V2 isoform X8 [Dermacentor silvarum]|uniref:cytochrome P450 4V2 isoform X8 n=1 Tax=Dermacentor silvarum TaxID=543639 RepID=UPI002100B2AF|nr:cytochrome P450 4V2 isoform X8 [Dermacentor silvarum]